MDVLPYQGSTQTVRGRPAGDAVRGEHPSLDASERLTFEGLLQGVRLTFLASPILAFLAFGPSTLPFGAMMVAAILASYAFVRLLGRRSPWSVLRYQLWLRVLDVVLVALVVGRYHAFLGNSYYDATYLPFVVAAAATHGRRGAVLLSGISTLAILCSRGLLVVTGTLQPEVRHVTDALFYGLLFLGTGIAVALLMRRSGATVARRERSWNAALARTNAELAELAQENARLYEQAAAALRMSRDVLASASHDLKNPLVTIRAYSEMLRRDSAKAGALSEPRQGERLARIEAAARQIQSLADELADVARLEMGERLELDRSETDLVALVGRAVDAWQLDPSERTIRFESRVPAAIGEWDAARLDRVLANLIQNAVKYSPKGAQVEVRLDVDPEADLARVVVRDHGIGIPAGDMPHIFQRFHRGSNVTSRTRGTGLGLAGVRDIVEQHGGRVTIKSEEGTGTEVTVELPFAPPEEDEQEPTAAADDLVAVGAA